MVEHGKIISSGLKFCIEPKRWLPFFAIDSIVLMLAGMYLISNVNVFSEFAAANTGGVPPNIALVTGTASVLIILGIVWFFARLYIKGALIYQSFKPKDFNKSFDVSKERFFTLLAIAIIMSVISGLAGMFPYVGWIVSVLVALMFFFAMPIAVIKKRKFDDSLSESVEIFRKRAADVFVSWLLMVIVSGVIVFIFAIPALITMFNSIMPVIIAAQGNNISGILLLNSLIANIWILIPGIVLFVLGSSLSDVYNTHVQTNYYSEFKKKK